LTYLFGKDQLIPCEVFGRFSQGIVSSLQNTQGPSPLKQELRNLSNPEEDLDKESPIR
jgi:hypothetical protein